MSSEPMELAKNWDPDKWQKVLPAYAQIKYDGVPLTFIRRDGIVVALSRQNEVMTSVPHMLKWAEYLLLHEGASFTAECLVLGLPFKDCSGIIRRDEPNDAIIGYIFDANLMARPKDTYYTRINQMKVQAAALKYDAGDRPFPFFMPPMVLVEDADKVPKLLEGLQARIPGLEGIMLHSLQKPFQPGKRCWGMSRVKPQPTIDLEVVSFEEARSEAGEPLGMLGRVNVRLRRRYPLGEVGKGKQVASGVFESVIGIGPGKLDHDERRGWWNDYNVGALSATSLIAEIKYMPDPSYDALRQPTIQRFRTDKTEGDILEY